MNNVMLADLERALEIARELFQTPVIEQNHSHYIDNAIKHWKIMMFNNGMVCNVYCNTLKDVLVSEFMLVESGEIVYTASVHKLSTCSLYTMIGYTIASMYKAIESVQGTI